ncbi:metal-binding protein [Microcoleus sp. FACHB-SPT15]|uniref:metal-binding protein n=1 Tax=Microcoleus sp. FACHB-SPT15 TaxID=2692830 RepID=UPI001786636D|nr:metal-binding protein [Microcoleus sp. FACHB-SPT15]MBD1804067.1 metal-binding protein [Microcoleus sp. FACHB-SPT15]
MKIRRCSIASGRRHDQAILFTTPIIGIIGVSHSLELGIISMSAHCLGGLYLSPDLDLVSKPYKRWGWLRWIWIPYQKYIPHRSPLSHAPLLGSTIRLLYFSALLLPFWFIFPGLRQVE